MQAEHALGYRKLNGCGRRGVAALLVGAGALAGTRPRLTRARARMHRARAVQARAPPEALRERAGGIRRSRLRIVTAIERADEQEVPGEHEHVREVERDPVDAVAEHQRVRDAVAVEARRDEVPDHAAHHHARGDRDAPRRDGREGEQPDQHDERERDPGRRALVDVPGRRRDRRLDAEVGRCEHGRRRADDEQEPLGELLLARVDTGRRLHESIVPAGTRAAGASGTSSGRTRPCACQAAIAATHTAPAAITRPCAATPNASASSVPIPAATRIAAPAPAWVTAPAGAIGSTAEAEEAQRNASARAKLVGSPSAPSRTKSASPRSVHETATAAQAVTASRGGVAFSDTQRLKRKRASPAQPDEPRQARARARRRRRPRRRPRSAPRARRRRRR